MAPSPRLDRLFQGCGATGVGDRCCVLGVGDGSGVSDIAEGCRADSVEDERTLLSSYEGHCDEEHEQDAGGEVRRLPATTYGLVSRLTGFGLDLGHWTLNPEAT